jgi:hypothetical protein
MVEAFIFAAYIAGTAFGFYWGIERGRTKAIVDTIDSLIDQGFIKYKGLKSDPEIMKHDEDY